MTSTGWYPEARRLNISTHEFWTSRTEPILAICNHITDGVDSRDYLQNANNGSSVHFLVRDEGGVGVVYQFMPVEWAAWGNGITSQNNPYTPAWLAQKIAQGVNPNMCTVSIEHERKWPFSTMPSMAMMGASIKLQKWLCENYPTIKRDRDHIIGHYQIDNVNKANCPGGPGGKLYPFAMVVQALNSADTGPLIIPGARWTLTVPEFKTFWLGEPKALQYWGLPIEASRVARLSDGNLYTVQYFERARFELHGSQVMLGLVGAEVLAK